MLIRINGTLVNSQVVKYIVTCDHELSHEVTTYSIAVAFTCGGPDLEVEFGSKENRDNAFLRLSNLFNCTDAISISSAA